MPRIITFTENCKNCLLCVNACPKNAIRELGELNKKGYKVIRVDEDKCIYCGSCYQACPDYVFELCE